MIRRVGARLADRLFASLYDRLSAAGEEAGFADLRRALLQDARGRVLEVGAGTGLNLEHYPQNVAELVLTEPLQPMAERLRRRVQGGTVPATVAEAPAEALPFPDTSFDTVVCTLVLCSVPDQASALREIRRVLRTDGRLLFLEHVRSEDARVARRQERVTPLWKVIGHGCRPNRATLESIEAGPFEVETVDRRPAPKALQVVRPLVVGRARAA